MRKGFYIILLCLLTIGLQACELLADNGSLPVESPSPIPVVEKPVSTFSFPGGDITQTSTAFVPTLDEKEAEEQILALLKDNGGCELPCWWGILPGESSVKQIKEKLAPMAATISMLPSLPTTILEKRFIGYGIKTNLQVEDNILDISAYWYAPENRDEIELVNIKSAAYKLENGVYRSLYDSKIYHDYFNRYSISKILLGLGKPSRILTFAEVYNPNPNSNPETFQVWLLYPQKGVFVRYDMQMRRIGKFGQSCLSGSFVSLWLTPPDTFNYYTEVISFMDGYSSFSNHKNIEDATALNIDKFYTAYTRSDDHCLQTPLSIWPVH